jgi:small subunit ribosomal protein S13
MARIAGVDLPRNKQARIALTYIFGIGNPRALKILERANVDAFKKIQDLGEDEVNRIRQVIEDEGNVEGDLRKDVQMHIKRLIDIQSYRGTRHRRGLPVNGQRTHTNARTRKGPRKGTIAGKKKATGKRPANPQPASQARTRSSRSANARMCRLALRTCRPPSTTPSSPSPTRWATH